MSAVTHENLQNLAHPSLGAAYLELQHVVAMVDTWVDTGDLPPGRHAIPLSHELFTEYCNASLKANTDEEQAYLLAYVFDVSLDARKALVDLDKAQGSISDTLGARGHYESAVAELRSAFTVVTETLETAMADPDLALAVPGQSIASVAEAQTKQGITSLTEGLSLVGAEPAGIGR